MSGIEAGGYPWPYGAYLNADDLNVALEGNPGLSAPARIAGFKRWIDLSQAGYALERHSDGVVNILTGAFDTANHLWLPPLGGGVATIVNSTGVVELGSIPESVVNLTAATLTSLGSGLQKGCAKLILFAGATHIVQGAGSLQLIGTSGQDVTTAAGDLALAVALGNGVFALAYLPVTPLGVVTPAPPPFGVSLPGATTVPAGATRVYVATSGLVSLTLPKNDCLVMDRGPQAGTYPITCLPPAGTTINQTANYVLVGDWASAEFIWDGAMLGVR